MTLQGKLEQRVALAYSRVPNFKRMKYSAEDAAALNDALRVYYRDLPDRRDKLANRGVNSFVAASNQMTTAWINEFGKREYLNAVSDHVAYLYAAGGTKHSTPAENRAYVEDRLTRNTIDSQRLDDIITSASNAAGVQFTEAVLQLHRLQALLHFQAVEGFRQTLRHLDSVATLLAATKAVPTTLTPADLMLVDIIFSNPYQEVADSILARQNLITSLGAHSAAFQDIKDTIRREIYERPDGALGARDLARRLQQDLVKTYGSQFPLYTKEKYMLWARTEGAVIQNDALMQLGTKAKMDGKIWQSVGDSLVRDGSRGIGDHVTNEYDGVIPVGRPFSDGSMDGGSGSVSIYNCRCCVGGALLEMDAVPVSGIQ